MATPTIVIFMGGGLIQNIETDHHVNLVVVDYDLEGIEPERIKQTPYGGQATIELYADDNLSAKDRAAYLELAKGA